MRYHSVRRCMPFTEGLRAAIRRRAHLKCCVCHAVGVDIHHIVPQSEGGADTADNAAPLCPSCHGVYGANPQKRKLVREARDLWYEICDTRFASPRNELGALFELLRNVATKEDVERLALRNGGVALGPAYNHCDALNDGFQYSFEREDFIHPRIVEELIGWLPDPAATVIAIDLSVANASNRFFGEFTKAERDERIWVTFDRGEAGSFTYAHIATSPSGIQMVECYSHTGGTGIFGDVALFSIEQDRALSRESSASPRTRLLLKTLGTVGLGDRYFGRISYDGEVLSIGPDEGIFARGTTAAKALLVR
jgi:hypothetical protein